ncbi:FkbM family methyltransferase [Streptomyces armeniacus]|uniref:FkbM family methyltransferase n=1 Tax=Streptomyces armeniacus TaxID=83291 RepID=A0A345XQA2_9ACTN|nr:FkbM family methyltransferase [Streptomyces armeniacus]AXK33818.1 FkbM family methyltransferase [Streptomyces armeniacus]QIQ28597.1 Nbc1 [Streptomyces sp.]
MTEIRSVQVADGVSFFVPQAGGEQFSEVGFIYKEIFEDRTYLRHGIKLSDTSRIVDCGANVGLFTLFVKQQFPGAQVLAMEPIPPIYEALQRNLDAHGVKGVDTRRMALGQRNEKVHFTFYPAVPGNSTRYPEQKKVGQELTVEQIGQAEVDRVMTGLDVEAQVDRLSTVLRDWAPGEQIDLLKIDVEGAELDVMQGLDDEDWLRIDQAVIEVQDLDGRLDTIIDTLDGKGFSVVVERAELPEVYRYYMVYATRQP